jgi:hypothetical protein
MARDGSVDNFRDDPSGSPTLAPTASRKESMYSDPYSGLLAAYGLFLILAVVLYVGVLAVVLWVAYILMRTAVKNGILLADQQRAQSLSRGPAGAPVPPAHPHAPRTA